MVILITGGSGSGKSKFGENLTVKLKKDRLIYIATMMAFDVESRKRIQRHREMRKDKDFQTLERYTDMKGITLMGKPTVLLECMSNLLANEMYSETGILSCNKEADLCEEIVNGIKSLASQCEHVVIITNEVFSDNGSVYEETNEYIKTLGKINVRLSAMASYVYEVVCGIPIELKGEGGKIT